MVTSMYWCLPQLTVVVWEGMGGLLNVLELTWKFIFSSLNMDKNDKVLRLLTLVDGFLQKLSKSSFPCIECVCMCS